MRSGFCVDEGLFATTERVALQVAGFRADGAIVPINSGPESAPRGHGRQNPVEKATCATEKFGSSPRLGHV